ncbi:MAG TPA: capsular polysaccharide synthesis protein [Povalibacter sp.]|uniref:hypothetical protein n=1 Tax=Povalibacter sp. TaxID=1962978 RepID=UPI002C4B8DFE|nr:hypothetical protein [Povalibacter sp.]HMN46685.1 capsular polysaccharide synthesis protein [Povalibacter sp.]
MALVSGLWVGSRFSPLERACIASFLQHGHHFDLYTYDSVEGVPDGCRIVSAASIVPRERICVQASAGGQGGGIAAFSDLFRYELLLRQGGWWVDLDVFCLSASLPEQEIVIARQGPTVVNGAVLRFPQGHPLMAAARAACETKASGCNWGELGPDLLTRLVREMELQSVVMPPQMFYPIDWQHYWAVLDPRRSADVLQRMQAAVCLHLWNEMLRRIGIDKHVLPPQGSVLRALYETTIGLNEFEHEYVLAPDCPDNALDLMTRPFNPSRIEGPRSDQ